MGWDTLVGCKKIFSGSQQEVHNHGFTSLDKRTKGLTTTQCFHGLKVTLIVSSKNLVAHKTVESLIFSFLMKRPQKIGKMKNYQKTKLKE